MRLYYLLVLLTTLLLSSCASKVKNIKQDKVLTNVSDGTSKASYLLLGIETNSDLKSIALSGTKNVELTSKDIKYGTNYVLAILPPGQYRIETVYLSNYSYIELEDKDNWLFELKPNSTNYVGHIEVTKKQSLSRLTRLELVNRSSEALEFLEFKFPIIKSTSPIVYQGPGADYFLDYLNQSK